MQISALITNYPLKEERNMVLIIMVSLWVYQKKHGYYYVGQRKASITLENLFGLS